jgi:hypothetical protein
MSDQNQPSSSIFGDLSKIGNTYTKVAIRLGVEETEKDVVTGREIKRLVPHAESPAMAFMIRNITPNELKEADSMIVASPPAVYEDRISPTGRGSVRTLVGYDREEPQYLRDLESQMPRRQAVICLYGCQGLAGSTPGSSLTEKVDQLVDKVPAPLLAWLCEKIENIPCLFAVGEEEVERFLSQDSGDTPGTKSSSSASDPGRKNKQRSGPKGGTSTTK